MASVVEPDPDGDSTGTLRVRFQVGRVPDRGRAATHVAGLWAPGVSFEDGEVSAPLFAVAGRYALFEGRPVRVPLSGGPDLVATVILRGFSIACATSRVGLHAQGFGVMLARPRVVAGALEFVPAMVVRAAPSPDPLTGWRGVFGFEMVAPYTVVWGPAALLHVQRDEAMPTASAVRRHRRPSVHAAAMVGRAGSRYRHAAVGIHGFSWSLGQSSRSGRDGRYIRRLSTSVVANGYDPDSGTGSVLASFAFSNRGIVTYPVHARQRVWTTLVQVADGAVLPQQRIEVPIRTGIDDGARAAVRFRLGPP